jgi:hypothetical protein
MKHFKYFHMQRKIKDSRPTQRRISWLPEKKKKIGGDVGPDM